MGSKQPVELVKDEALERVAAAAISKLLVLLPPWAVLILLLGLGEISHVKWGKPPAVAWATMAGTLCAVIVSALTWLVSHNRGLLGRLHSTLTAGGALLWFTVATVTGPTSPVTFGGWFFFGGITAVCWNVRAVIRTHNPDGMGHGDPLANLFEQAKASFGMDGARVRTRQVTDHKISAQMALPAGKKTVEDVVKKADYMESGMGLPAGAVSVTADENRADRANMTITNPLTMKKPLPWAGVSAPGASIAEPLRVGLFQDMEPVLHTIPGHHLQVMGMSGSGKSIGACWNYLAEIITRHDVAIFAADISKGDQTLGPFRGSMHRFETTKAGARQLMKDIEAQIKARTDWLAANGYQKWVPECGLTYWIVWLEEAPKIIAALGDKGSDKFLEILKELRSAGGTVVMSLQRADYTQMPTLARGQLANMCLGVATDSDATFGLSSAQQDAEARPETWTNKRPGMAYLDAPSIPETHIAMPLRTYAWSTITGDEKASDRQAREKITAHVAAWPADAKVVDEFTARVAAIPCQVGTPALTGAAPAAVGAQPSLTGGRAAIEAPQDAEDAAEAALEQLAAAAEHIVAAQRVDLGDLDLAPVERLRVLEALERKGIIGPAGPDGDRQVLVNADEAIAGILDDGDPVSEYMRTADPSPEITAGPDDEVPELTAEEAVLETEQETPVRDLGPVEARQVMYAWIRHRAAEGPTTFTASDPGLKEVRAEAGDKGRAWVYKVLGELEDAGVIARTDDGFTIDGAELLDEIGTRP